MAKAPLGLAMKPREALWADRGRRAAERIGGETVTMVEAVTASWLSTFVLVSGYCRAEYDVVSGE